MSARIFTMMREIGVFNVSVGCDHHLDAWRVTWIWGPDVREPIHDYLLRETQWREGRENNLMILKAFAVLTK